MASHQCSIFSAYLILLICPVKNGGITQIAQVIGVAVMQLLVEKQKPSREALIEMIQVLWQEDQVDLAVELALDVLMLPKE
ncbi:hypothetical protein AI2709V1_2829 [Klebsiella pneumoniae]|nr:hypothetical protein AI2709V1_2829 [Klebsiella pneumoniae]CAH3549760.1 hypothetical protein AI2709V1_2829 [Klebsiella pneumoniae]